MKAARDPCNAPGARVILNNNTLSLASSKESNYAQMIEHNPIRRSSKFPSSNKQDRIPHSCSTGTRDAAVNRIHSTRRPHNLTWLESVALKSERNLPSSKHYFSLKAVWRGLGSHKGHRICCRHRTEQGVDLLEDYSGFHSLGARFFDCVLRTAVAMGDRSSW